MNSPATWLRRVRVTGSLRLHSLYSSPNIPGYEECYESADGEARLTRFSHQYSLLSSLGVTLDRSGPSFRTIRVV